MSVQDSNASVARFGVFELDRAAGELRKRGVRLKLEEKPLQILQLLLERPGEVVPRKRIQESLWPETHVRFDLSLNTAVNKLRSVLGDTAVNPRFVETVSRRGYRFIGSVRAPSAWSGEQASARAGVRGMPGVISIAVLPFANTSGKPEMEYLSDGVTEGIIRSLSKIADVRVMAWSAVSRHRGDKADPRAAGRELNVEGVLVGGVLERGRTLLMHAELVDVETGWRLWGEQYKQKRSAIVALQTKIARAIGEKLRARMQQTGAEREARSYTRNAEAYADYLKGRYHWHKTSEESIQKSIEYFQQAIEKDPRFAMAHAGLADAYVMQVFMSLRAPDEVIPLARAAATKALELDEELSEAHASLAGIQKAYDWEWEAAERGYRRCLELNPSNTTGHRGYGSYLAALGRAEEAKLEMQRAQALDPLSLALSVEAAWYHYMVRDYAASVAQSRKTLEMEPRFPAAYHSLGLALEAQGKYAEAIKALEKSRALSQGHSIVLSSLGHCYAKAGREKDAREILKMLEDGARKKYIAPYSFAVIHIALGEIDAGLRWMEHGVATHDVWLVWMKQSPRLDPLRGDARFQNLMRKMKFPE
jgi:TolB-like protein/Tfp pilus assembly protein PilF